jgi:hypothetical protein
MYLSILTDFMELIPFWEAVKNFPNFMEPEGSLPCSQVPSTGPYPEPDQSISCHLIPSFFKLYINIILPTSSSS